MNLTESQIKMLKKIGVSIFCGSVVIAIIAGIVIFRKKAAKKPAADTAAAAVDTAAAADKAAADKAAADKAAVDTAAAADKAAADKAAADKAAAEKAAAEKAAAEKAAAALSDQKAKTAINAFTTEINKRDQAIQRLGNTGNTIELFYNAAKAAIAAEKETKDNYDLQITFNNNASLQDQANIMYQKAKADTKSAKDAFMAKYRYGLTWENSDIQKVNGWYNELK